MRKISCFLALLLLLCLAGCESSEKKAENASPNSQYSRAMEYSRSGNYTKAAYWYEKATAQGHNSAQVELARLYYEGLGVRHDYAEAFKLFTRAYQKGGGSMVDRYLTIMYMLGQGTAKNYTKAAEHLTNLVGNADPNAPKVLAYLYYTGKGVTQNYEEAARLYNISYKYGSGSAAISLAAMYEQGLGVPQDYAMADKLQAEAFVKLTDPDKSTGSLIHDVIRGPIAKDDDLIMIYMLADFYQFGLGGLTPDHNKAQKLYARAHKKMQNAPYYEIFMATMYHYGLGTKQDYVKAAELYAIAVTYDDEAAMYELGYLYEKGLGVEQSYAKAAELYTLAARYGFAEKELGDLYAKGLGVEQDNTKAFELYMKSANRGLPEGQYSLANAYFKGLGTNKNNENAWLWIKKAAANRLVKYFYNEDEKNELVNNINRLLKEIKSYQMPL